MTVRLFSLRERPDCIAGCNPGEGVSRRTNIPHVMLTKCSDRTRHPALQRHLLPHEQKGSRQLRSIRAKHPRSADTGAIVFILALKQRRPAMPANRCGKRPCLAARSLAAGIAALLVSREVDDVGSGYYDSLNHCCPRGVRQRYCRQVSLKSSAQRSNFTGEIAAAQAGFLSNIAPGEAYCIGVQMTRLTTTFST